MTRWALNVLAAWSQLWNAVWGGNRDQSFSSRSYEAKLLRKWWGPLGVWCVDRLFFFQPNHCARAYQSDEERTYDGDA